LKQQGWELSLQASMLEIYNEEYKDLLSNKKSNGSSKSTKEGFGSQQPNGESKKHQVCAMECSKIQQLRSPQNLNCQLDEAVRL
jgi:hypothetical protein